MARPAAADCYRRAVSTPGLTVSLGTSSLVGVALGLGGVQLPAPQLQSWSDRALDAIDLAPLTTVGMMALGVVAATVAAWVPAGAAARLPVLTALAGRRPPTAPSNRSPRRGLVLVSVGVELVLSAAHAGELLVMTTRSETSRDQPRREGGVARSQDMERRLPTEPAAAGTRRRDLPR